MKRGHFFVPLPPGNCLKNLTESDGDFSKSSKFANIIIIIIINKNNNNNM